MSDGNIYDSILAAAPSQNPEKSLTVNPRQPAPSVYDDLLAQEDQENNQRLIEAIRTRAGGDANFEAEAQRLGFETGVGADIARRNIQELRRRAAINQTEAKMGGITNPILRRQMADPDFAAIAYDDVDNLSFLDTQLNRLKKTGQASVSGLLGLSSGLVGMVRAPVELYGQGVDVLNRALGYDVTTSKGNLARQAGEWLGDYQADIQRDAKSWMPQSGGNLSGGFYSGVASLTRNVASLPLLLGGPAGARAYMGLMAGSVAGEEYGTAREAGLDPIQAAIYGTGQGTIEYVTEKIPLGALLGDFAKGTGFLKTLGRQALLEIPGEQVATIFQDMNEWATLHPEKPFADYLAERPSAAAQTLIATLVGVGGQVSIMKGTEYVLNRIDSAISFANQGLETGNILAQLNDAAINSKVRERNPMAYKSYLDADLAGTEAETMFVDGGQMANALRQANMRPEDVEQMLPGLQAKLAQAVATGGDVELQTSQFAAYVAGSKLGDAMLPHLRLTPESMSTAEAEQFEGQKRQLMDEAKTLLDAKRESDKAFTESAKRVRDTMYTQLKETKTMPAKAAALNADFVRDFVVTQAAKLKIQPEEFYNRYMYKVQAAREGATQADLFDQQGNVRTDSEAFQNWFRAGKIVDKEGKPQIVYHGTTREITRFERAPGVNGQIWGSGYYLTRDPKYASTFAKDYTKPPAEEDLGGNVLPLYVALQNPLTDAQELTDIKREVGGDADAITAEVKARGYDGIDVSIGGRNIIVAFDATDIKSINNRGDWSRESAELLAQRGKAAPKGKGGSTVGAQGAEAARKLREAVKAEGAKDVKDITADQVITDDRIPTITLQDLVGKRIFPTIADRTAAGVIYTGIDSSKPNVAIEMLGGPLFPLRESNFEAGVVWANRGKEVISAKGKKVAGGADYMIVLMGDANMHKSNTTVANVFFATLEAYVRDKRITKKNATALSKLIKESVTKDAEVQKYIDKFPGLDDMAKLEDYLHGISFTARARLIDILGSKAALELGAPSMEKILDATREPSMAGHRWGDGVLVVKIDKEKPFLTLGEEGTRLPPDFPLGMRGEVVGKLAAPLNYELLWQDWLANQKAAKLAENPDAKINTRRAFELAKPELEITQELVDRIGPIELGNIDGSRQAVLAVDMALDRWRTSNEAKNKGGVSPQGFVDAVAASPANVVLNEYKIEDVKAAIKDGSMRLYQLGDENSGIWFALKNGNPADDYGVQIEGLSEKDVTLTAVINNEQGARGIGGPAVVLKALQQGATVLDCFAVKSARFPTGFLPALYREFGFEIVGEIPFEPKYYSKQKLADAEKFWAESGWDKEQYGYPPVVIMKWSGTNEDRAGITERYLRDGVAGVLARGASANARAATALFGNNAGAQAGAATGTDAGRAGGNQGAAAQRSLASRAVSVAQDIAALTDNEARNLGISTADRDAIARGLQPGGVFNQLGVAEESTAAGRAEISRREAAERAGRFAQPARGGFDPKRLTTILNEKADLSTFLHETAHFFLTVYADMAALPDATDQMKADMQTILDWFGVADLDTWNKMSLEEQRKYHEQWAYNYELYLFEGKAPSVEMQSMFDKFSAWLKRVYLSIRDDLNRLYREEHNEDLPILTGEVRQVMDRMIASDDQIKRAEAVRNMEGLFQTQEQSGMDDAAWMAYQAMLDEAREAATIDLTKASLRQMQWLSNAKSRLLKEMQAKHDALRKEVRAQVEEEVKGEDVYKAIEFLKYGRVMDQEGNPIEVLQGNKLNLSEVKAMFPASKEALVPPPDFKKLGYGKYGMLSETGLSPDLVAQMFGFTSGEALVNALLTAKPIKEEIDARTDMRMLDEHGAMNTPAELEFEVEKALHNEARARFVAVELRFLSKATQPVRVMMKAAQEVARQIISGKKISEIKQRDYSVAEARAARQAMDAIKAGKSAEAARAKQNQLVQNQLTREAIAAKEEVAKALRSFKKIFRPDAKIAKTRNVDLVDAARSILAYYGLGKKDKAPTEYLEKLRAYNPDLYAELEPIILRAISGEPKTYRDLTMDEFRIMRDAVEALWFQAKRENEIMIEGKALDLNMVVGELNERLNEIGVPEEVPGERSAPSKRDRAVRSFYQAKAATRRIEHWADATDGPDGPGPFTKYIWRPIKDALNQYRETRNVYVKRYVELLEKLDLPVQKIEAPELNYTFGEDNGGIGKAEVLGALLHSGNESNLRKLLLGRGWGRQLEGGGVDTSRWDAFLDRMIAERKITKEDMDFVQAVWDLNEELKPMAQKAHHDLFGYYFREVEAMPVTAPWGVYRGGYVPAKTDQFIVRDAQRNSKMEELESDFRQSMPSTGMGFTKGRVEYNKALSLDIRLMAKHIDDVIRFAQVQPAVRDVLKLLRKREFADTLTRVDPTAIEDMLIPWLNRAARQITSEPGKHKAVDQFWSTVRARTGVGIMFANITNALQQVTGYFPAALKVRPSYLKSALANYMGNSQVVTQEVSELSSFMRDRLQNQIFDIQDTMNDLLLNPSRYEQVQKWGQRHGYFLQTAFQNQVDVVTWTATYNQALVELGVGVSDPEAVREAVQRADAAVRLTQSSLTAEDMAAFEVGTPFYKTLIQFSGYFNMLANLNANEYIKVIRDLGFRGNKGQLVYIYAMGFMLPMVVADAIVRSLGGQWDDEDDDGYLDEFMEWFFGSQVKGAAALVPFGSAAFTALTTAFNNKPYDDRMTTSPSVSTLEAATIGVGKTVINVASEDKDVTGKNVRDVLTLISLVTGIPVTVLGRPVGYVIDVEAGKTKPTGAVDVTRGLVTGKASEASKE